jgi:putative ABC transport system substrate-binding protein
MLAKELIALRPEVILAQSTPVAAVLQRETRAIAIVFTNVSDPIGSGFVSSLARPGGNLTGVIAYEPGIAGKWLAMLKEIAPRLKRAALLANPKATAFDYFVQNAKTAAASLDIEVVPSPINGIADRWLSAEPGGEVTSLPHRSQCPHRVFDRDQSETVPLCRNFYSGDGLL